MCSNTSQAHGAKTATDAKSPPCLVAQSTGTRPAGLCCWGRGGPVPGPRPRGAEAPPAAGAGVCPEESPLGHCPGPQRRGDGWEG